MDIPGDVIKPVSAHPKAPHLQASPGLGHYGSDGLWCGGGGSLGGGSERTRKPRTEGEDGRGLTLPLSFTEPESGRKACVCARSLPRAGCGEHEGVGERLTEQALTGLLLGQNSILLLPG